VFVHLGVVAAVVAALGLAYVGSDPVRAGVQQVISVLIGGDAAVIGDYLRSLGPWAPIVSVGLMVTQALLAPIPNVLVVFANGLAFGVGGGLAVSLLGQTVAAAVCFWVARAVGRRSAEALVGRFGLGTADRWFARWGTAGVLAARLLPGVPSDAVSFAAGLSGMRFGAFLAATAVGGVPQPSSTPTSASAPRSWSGGCLPPAWPSPPRSARRRSSGAGVGGRRSWRRAVRDRDPAPPPRLRRGARGGAAPLPNRSS
jgi:uncharacterized membrane protein YdjX (TVP38/TMEM64 family)